MSGQETSESRSTQTLQTYGEAQATRNYTIPTEDSLADLSCDCWRSA